jgi:hypothetical protein
VIAPSADWNEPSPLDGGRAGLARLADALDVLLLFLDATLLEWPHGKTKSLEDVKGDIAARSKKRTGIDGFEFHEGDDATITRHMDTQRNFECSTFGTPSKPSWKRR